MKLKQDINLNNLVMMTDLNEMFQNSEVRHDMMMAACLHYKTIQNRIECKSKMRKMAFKLKKVFNYLNDQLNNTGMQINQHQKNKVSAITAQRNKTVNDEKNEDRREI
jgi:hypothetical protein